MAVACCALLHANISHGMLTLSTFFVEDQWKEEGSKERLWYMIIKTCKLHEIPYYVTASYMVIIVLDYAIQL